VRAVDADQFATLHAALVGFQHHGVAWRRAATMTGAENAEDTRHQLSRAGRSSSA
jgi:hypothetical protein